MPSITTAACPPSVIDFNRGLPAPFSITAITFDSVLTDVWTAHPAFDRSAGRMSLSASSGGRLNASVRVVECFDVTGVPLGTPVDGTLQFQLDLRTLQDCGGSGCGMRFQGTVALPGDSVMADANLIGPTLGPRTVMTTISLPIHFVAGTPVTAQFFLDYGTGPGQTGAQADGTGAWSVAGLPPGVRAISATGFDVTPVRPKSWGALKAIYR